MSYFTSYSNAQITPQKAKYLRQNVIREEIKKTLKDDLPESIILGCAGMADSAKRLTVDFKLSFIDGVASAVGFVERLSSQGLKTNKILGYALPPKKFTRLAFLMINLIHNFFSKGVKLN